MNILGLIPARGGSKGIPDKNIIELGGKPLIAHTISAALNCDLLSRIIVSTDSNIIASIASDFGAEVPFIRPAEFSDDTAPAIAVINHLLNHLDDESQPLPDAIVYLQPTSPFRTSNDISECISLMQQKNADTVVSTVTVPHNFLPESLMRVGNDGELSFPRENMTLRRQNKTQRWVGRNGPAILLVKTETLLHKKLYGDRVFGYEMSRLRSLDIDDPVDLEVCRHVLPLLHDGLFG